MDYSTLAQISSPGKDPYGRVSAERVQRWDTLNRTNQQALAGSRRLADLDLGVQQQKATEFQAGAPGRMDEISLANINAANAIKPEEIQKREYTDNLKRLAQNEGFMKAVYGLAEKIGDQADGYVNQQDEGKKAEIIKQHHGLEVRDPSGRIYKIGTDPNKDRILFDSLGNARKNTAVLTAKKEIAQTGAAARVEAAKTGAMSRERVAAINAAVRKELEAAKAALIAKKPITASQAEAASVVAAANKLAEETGQDPDQLVAQHFFMKSQGAQFMKELQKSTTLQGLGVNAPSPEATSSPVAKTPITNKPKIPSNKNAIDVEQAKSILEDTKGKPNEETMIKFFVDTYGAENLPAWAKKQ